MKSSGFCLRNYAQGQPRSILGQSIYGIEYLMESHATPLLLLPQSKLVENTVRFLQSKNWKIDTQKCGRYWICSQNLVSSLTKTKFYNRVSIPPLEMEVSLLDFSSKGKCSIPMRNIEIWEKRAHKLIAVNSHADLFSSAACMQQQTMSMPAFSRLLEAVAKWIKPATAMSTILTTEIFQARRDAVLATSKLLLENSNYELHNAPINSKTLFGNKIGSCQGQFWGPTNPVSAPLTVIADFLIYLFSEKKYQISTIKGYRSISNTLKFKTGNRIGSNPVLSELIWSFELQRPVQRSLTPKWDLSWVLVCLQKAPYEPLHKASKLHVTLKTACLLALATFTPFYANSSTLSIG